MNNAINLLPCPMCGCNSITIKNEQPTDNSGGYFIECPDCGTSTSLRYACGDDPMPLLAEQWNRRTSTQHLRQIAEPAQAGEPVVSMLTFVNGEPAKCGCRFSHSDGGGEYSNVDSVTLCAKHAGNRTERASPFMWAIKEPGGGAYMDENCVSTSRGIVEAEVDGLNLGLDADDEPYKVVPVYLAAAPQAVQAAVPEAIEQMAVDRYKVVPSHESMFHRWAVVAGNGTQQLYIGREVECQNMALKFAGAFLDGAFVAMQNTAPAHPAEGVPAQAAATQPAEQGMDAEIQQAVEAERERICAAIKAEDDHCVDQGDYMLDSNDCIEIVRGKWVRPDYSLDAAQAKQGGA